MNFKLWLENIDKLHSSEFMGWFSSSKVVDDVGKPLMVYHGTTKDFDEFNPERSHGRYGIYFTDSPAVADISSLGKGEIGARTIPVYLRILNPKYIEWRDIIQLDKKTVDILQGQGYDGLIAVRDDGSKEFVVFKPTQIKFAYV